MKIVNNLLLWALLAVALPGWAQDERQETPQDYAWGAAINAQTPSPLYQLSLPENVYTESAWSDLRDVRVFNQKGETVPFTLIPDVQKNQQVESLALRVFPVAAMPEKNTGADTLWLRSQNGIEIRLEGDVKEATGARYLLALPDGRKDEFTLSQLKLAWRDAPANWQGRVDVFYSSDLKSWLPFAGDMPLMDLTTGGDRLLLDSVENTMTIMPPDIRYLLVVFRDAAHSVTLTGATAIAKGHVDDVKNIPLAATERAVSSSVREYHWPQPQPLVTLNLEMQNGQALPVQIDYRRDAQAEWQPLTKKVIYQFNGSASGAIALDGGGVQAIRVTAINGQLGDAQIAVSGERVSQMLVFNAQGNGPFLLAWGNKAARTQALEETMLLPPELRQSGAGTLPYADAQEKITLGGEARLTAVDPVEQRSQWQTMLLWAALVLGVLVFIWIALKIWREVRGQA
ncbi:Protein of unknown function [Enterobacter sp. kpr-6]|uniref:DUF3999 family protein n=1 Tax=Enterobacter sp. kpr-6 TaxID=1761782 RepID=UPI0008F311C1|nr:DUF3999 family protein [Enterobacter sp. kpr-6]SFR04088.1 Protein of unknown function [Enterobacter sp. kpr-6]